MTLGYMPPRLPVSCLTTAPRFDNAKINVNMNFGSFRGPLAEINSDTRQGGSGLKKSPSVASSIGSQPPNDYHIKDLQKQLKALVDARPAEKLPTMHDEAEDPKCLPMVWVSKWVDYSDKYGFGYALSDDSIGVLFNDVTKLLLLSDGQ